PDLGASRAIHREVRRKLVRRARGHIESLGAELARQGKTFRATACHGRPAAAPADHERPEQSQRAGAVNEEAVASVREAIPTVKNGRQRIQKRGDLVGDIVGNAMKIRSHDRGWHSEKFRERAPRAVGMAGGAEIRETTPALVACAAWTGYAGHHAVADGEASHTLSNLHDLARTFVSHRHRQCDPRVPAREEFQVRPTRQRGPDPQDHFSRTGLRHRKIALAKLPDGGLNESLHALRSSTNRAKSGRRPPRRGSVVAVSTASSIFSRSIARERSTPQIPGNVALPAAASLPEDFP